jgi:hypothetical protein
MRGGREVGESVCRYHRGAIGGPGAVVVLNDGEADAEMIP